MEDKKRNQATPPPYSDPGLEGTEAPPKDDKPFSGDLLGSYGDDRFKSQKTLHKEAKEETTPEKTTTLKETAKD